MKTLIITYPHRRDENGNPITKVMHVQSTTGKQTMPINNWFKYIANKSVQKLFLNRFK